ncbi:23357_t:CDS:2, partial [Dentiscutata erythropus]
MTFEYINGDDRPLSRYTNSKESTIKNFKVKLLIKELPNFKNLYIRDKNKYISSEYRRCNTEIEDDTYWLSCEKKMIKIEEIICEAITKIENEEKIKAVNINKFIAKFKSIHLDKKIPIGVLTTKMKFLNNDENRIESQKYQLTEINQNINLNDIESTIEFNETPVNSYIVKWSEQF